MLNKDSTNQRNMAMRREHNLESHMVVSHTDMEDHLIDEGPICGLEVMVNTTKP